MITFFYLLSLIFVMAILKPHPTSMAFVFLVNFLTGFTPLITLFFQYDLVIFNRDLVLSLILLFNSSIFVLHTIFLFFRKNENHYLVHRKYKYTNVLLFFFSFSAALVVYQNVTQGIEVIGQGYIAGYKSASEQTVKATSFFPFLLIFYFLIFIFYLKTKKIIYLFIMILILISYFLYGSRSFFLYTSISIVVFLIYLKMVTYRKCLIISILILPLILTAGAVREGGISESTNLLFRMALELANIPMIISNLNVLDDLDQSFISIILSTLPQSIILPLGFEPLNSLATEFVVQYDPGWAEAGGGFGFTIIGEIYYRFGYLGLILIPYIIVQFLHKLELIFIKGDEFDKALTLTAYYGLLMWVRGDFIEISRLFLIVFFFYLTKRLVYRDER